MTVIIITNEEKEKLKLNFKGNYNIKEVIDYIDQITNIYIYIYKNLITKVYYNINIDNQFDLKKFELIIRRCHKVLENNTNIYTIHLIPTEAKKILDFDNILTAKNVNSGFTYANGNDIYIFRKEEYPKVIIHELLHHNKDLHNDTFNNSNKEALMKHFDITKDTILILNETLIELHALLLHLTYISQEYKMDLKKLFKKELDYSIYKSSQILKLKKKNKKWCDKCNIYSYIIFKTIIMINLKEFFKSFTYPYNDTMVTNFIIDNSKSLFDLCKKNKKKKFQRPDNSLCFMLSSDL